MNKVIKKEKVWFVRKWWYWHFWDGELSLNANGQLQLKARKYAIPEDSPLFVYEWFRDFSRRTAGERKEIFTISTGEIQKIERVWFFLNKNVLRITDGKGRSFTMVVGDYNEWVKVLRAS